MLEYPCEYLILPLVWDCILHLHLLYLIQQRRRAAALAQRLVELVAAYTVGALGADDEHRAVICRRLRGRQTLDRLIYILIQRRAAVGRDDDISLMLGRYRAVPLQEAASGMMSLDAVSCKCRDHPLLLVYHYIDDIGQLRHPRGSLHIPVDGIALQHAHTRAVIRYKSGAMIAQYRLSRTDAGEYALASSRISREEMRLDETLRHDQISLCDQRIDHEMRTRRKHPYIRRGRAVAVVHHYLLASHYLLSELGDQLFLLRASVTSRRHEKCDIDIRVALAQLGEHQRDDISARDRAGMVAYDDHRRSLAPGELAQTLPCDGMLHGIPYYLRLIPV